MSTHPRTAKDRSTQLVAPVATARYQFQPRSRRADRPRNPPPVCTERHGADAFLAKARFGPVWLREEQVDPRTEAEALGSLAYAYEAFSVPQPPVAEPFPLNVVVQVKELQRVLGEEQRIRLIQDTDHAACVIRTVTFNTGPDTFFIPLKEVATLRRRRPKARITQVIGCILSYFIHTAKLPGLHQATGYLSHEATDFIDRQADELAELDEADLSEQEEVRSELKRRQRLVRLERKQVARMAHWLTQFNPAQFNQLLASYKPRSTQDHLVMQVARQVASLASAYPTSTYHTCFAGCVLDEHETYLHPENYMGVLWDVESAFSENLFDSLDMEWNSGAIPEEPMDTHYFNGPGLPPAPFAFTTPFFNALRTTISLLHTLP